MWIERLQSAMHTQKIFDKRAKQRERESEIIATTSSWYYILLGLYMLIGAHHTTTTTAPPPATPATTTASNQHTKKETANNNNNNTNQDQLRQAKVAAVIVEIFKRVRRIQSKHFHWTWHDLVNALACGLYSPLGYTFRSLRSFFFSLSLSYFR